MPILSSDLLQAATIEEHGYDYQKDLAGVLLPNYLDKQDHYNQAKKTFTTLCKVKETLKKVCRQVEISLKGCSSISINMDLIWNDNHNLTSKNNDNMMFGNLKDESAYKVKLRLLFGINQLLNDNLDMIVSTILKSILVLDDCQSNFEQLLNTSELLVNRCSVLESDISYIKKENDNLNCQKYYLEKQLSESVSSSTKYRSALCKSIKTVQKLYLENELYKKELSNIENQLIISKLRVAQYNEELEHIRTLLKYYRSQVSSESVLSPAIEQILKVEPCRVTSQTIPNIPNRKEYLNSKQSEPSTRHSNKYHHQLGNLLTRFLSFSYTTTNKSLRNLVYYGSQNKDNLNFNEKSLIKSPVYIEKSEILSNIIIEDNIKGLGDKKLELNPDEILTSPSTSNICSSGSSTS
ncbi:hypothetical protein cand_004000 [Cryptosporidium andersoni]|uniref:Uncharacterized protein n=1 Tax=Cryptosporidium andersoni TaxID=117008 RepID=A0A1J4MLS8_9CRYT|nr:hypothetical protein cand_004000 [Cryptosporidium andersoni]